MNDAKNSENETQPETEETPAESQAPEEPGAGEESAQAEAGAEEAPAEPSADAEAAGEDEAPKKKKKKKGPIRVGMIIPALLLVLVVGVGLYLRRNPIILASVIHGGRSAFQSDVSLVKVDSSIDWKEAKVDLSQLQIPDRADLARNSIQATELSTAMSTADLFRGTVHVEHVLVKDLALFAPRPEPAKPIPGAPLPGGPLAGEKGGPGPDLGEILAAFDVRDVPFEEVLAALDLQTVAYVKGFRSRQEDRQKAWTGKLEGQQEALRELQTRSKDQLEEASHLARSMQQEWNTAYGQKRDELNALKTKLEKDPNALGGNPVIEVPKRVKQKVDELNSIRSAQAKRAEELKAKLDAARKELGVVTSGMKELEADGRLALKEFNGEVSKARTAIDADTKKIASWLDPSEEQVMELLSILFGPEVVEQIEQARTTIALLQRLLPHEQDRRSAPPKTPREGQVFEFPRLAADGSLDPVGRVKLLVDDVELTGKLYLAQEKAEDRVVSLEGHAKNISDAPRRCGRQLEFDLSCQIKDAEQLYAFRAQGGFDPTNDTTRFSTSWKDYELKNVVLLDGEPEAGDPFPRSLRHATVDCELSVTSSPERFAVTIEAAFRAVEWGQTPAAKKPIVAAVRRAVSGAKELKLAIAYVQDAKGSKLTVEDPGLGKALSDELAAFVKEEVDKATAKHTKSLTAHLDTQAAEARKELDAGRAALTKGLGAVEAEERKLNAALEGNDLDGVLSGMDRAKEQLAKDKSAELLAAATKGKIKIPKEIPKLPGGLFGND